MITPLSLVATASLWFVRDVKYCKRTCRVSQICQNSRNVDIPVKALIQISVKQWNTSHLTPKPVETELSETKQRIERPNLERSKEENVPFLIKICLC